MDLAKYRKQPSEMARHKSLMEMLPNRFQEALDIGARDGYFSRLLAERAERKVYALDLERPNIDNPKVENVQGDITNLAFPDRHFDVVFCAEVLEHIPQLEAASRELERVTRGTLVIGVPYRQDTRIGRLTCQQCGRINPPNGHLHEFDEEVLTRLFPMLRAERIDLVWENCEATNALAVKLMDWAGNPWGSYDQEEPCIFCGEAFGKAPSSSFRTKVLARLALWINRWEGARRPPRGNWIHIRFTRPSSQS